jgi:hypothetical protein
VSDRRRQNLCTENPDLSSCDGGIIRFVREQTEAIFPLHIIGMEFNLSRLPDSAIHVSGFGGGDGGVVWLDTVLRLWRLILICRWCLFNLVSHGTACLPSVDVTACRISTAFSVPGRP